MPKKNELSKAILASMTAIYGAGVVAQDEVSPLMEEVVVEGIRASLSRAADRKRDANKIQDSIVAEDIGKFPDQNVAESLQRIAGVSISRVNGEGSQVSVRSFGPEFNVVKLNHRTLATVNGGRSFDFQILPSELIGGADVIKTPTADLSAGSIGAYINVRTARPLDNAGFHATGSTKLNYHGLAEDSNPEAAGVVSNTFADDTFGVLVGVSFKETDGRIDNYRTSHWHQYASGGFGLPMGDDTLGEDGNPTSLEGSRGPGRTIFNMVDENRERTGGNVVLQWEPGENFSSTFDALYTKLDREFLGSGLQVPMQHLGKYTRAVVSDSGTLLEATIADTDVEMNVDYGLQESTTAAYGWNSVFNRGNLTLEVDASWSRAESTFEGDNTTALHYTRFDENGVAQPSEIILDYRNDIPSLSTTGSLDVTDISKVRAAWQRYAASESEDEVKELKLDALYEIDVGVIKSVKAGAAYAGRTIEFNEFGTEFDAETGGADWGGGGAVMWIGDGSTWNPDTNLGVLPAEVLELSDSNFMDGEGGNFPRQWVQITDHEAYRAATQAYLEQAVANGDDWRAALVNAGWDTVYPGAGGSYGNEEDTVAAYVQLNLEGELGDYAWSGNLGGRYVSIENAASGTASTIDLLTLNEESSDLPEKVHNAATTSAKSLTFETSEEYFLPSVNFSLNLNNGNYLRAAAAKTITQPSLADKRASLSESPGLENPTVTIAGSNPLLESYRVNQFDLSFEHYADNGSAYSVGYFYKDISDFISTLTTVGPWDGPIAQDLADAYAANGQTVIFQSERKENRPGGKVQGIELGVLHYFDNLPGIWSGLGIQANYTYADSEDKDAAPINLPLVPEPGNVLEGFAKNSYNLVGFYDKDRLQARIAYNWRDEFMNSRSGDGLQPEYTDAYGQLDLSLSYDVTDNLTAAFEAINVTNETRLQYFGQRDRVSLVQMSGARYQFGIRANF